MLGFYNLKNRIGEEFLFLVNNKIGDDEFVKEIFLAMLIEFDGEYIIVRQKYTSTDRNFVESLLTQDRKLLKSKFKIIDDSEMKFTSLYF